MITYDNKMIKLEQKKKLQLLCMQYLKLKTNIYLYFYFKGNIKVIRNKLLKKILGKY